jgi:hypothetical protein
MPAQSNFRDGQVLTAAQLNASFASAASEADMQQIQNGTAPDAGVLTGAEIFPLSRTAGLFGTVPSKIADFVLGQLTMQDGAALASYTGAKTFVVLTAQGIAGQFGRLASTVGVTNNGGTIIFDGSDRAWQRLGIGPVVRAEWFGWSGGEAGQVLNAAIAAAVYHGVGTVTYDSPNFNQRTTINHSSAVTIRGPELGPRAVIRWAAGVPFTGHIQTSNFATQYVTQPTTTANGVCYDFGLENVVFDGNCGQAQLVAPTTNPIVAGLMLYGARPRYRNVILIRQPGIGALITFTTTPVYTDFGNNLLTESRDGAYFENVVILDSYYEGIVYEGPSDITIKEVRVGWPANSLWATAYSGRKSLLLPKARLRGITCTPGIGYTQAGTTWSIATDATTAPTVQPVIVNGGIDHWMILTNGSADATYCTITIFGDGTGATAACIIGNWIVGALVYNKGGEFGFIHAYNNAQGPNFEARNDDSGSFPRVNIGFLMAESGWLGALIGDNVEYQIGRLDTHSNGAYGGPAILGSLAITSNRGGMIANWKERRDISSGNGMLSLLVRGRGNVVRGRVQSNSGYAGSAILIGAIGNSVDVTVQDINGFALSTDYDIACASIRLVSNSNQGVWNNYANSPTISNIDSTVSIAAYSSNISVSANYVGLNNFSSGQWRAVTIIDKNIGNGSIAYSNATVSGAVDLTNSSEQTLTLNNPTVRIPQLSDCKVQVAPNTGATMTGAAYAYVTAVNATQITVKVKLTGVGTGAGSALVTIG